MSLSSFFASFWGWDAIRDRGQRRPVRTRVYDQDRHLLDRNRDRMIATTLDAHRNFTLCSWMVRKHLDYVASFSFQSTSENDAWNEELERFIKQKSQRCDVRGRHPLRRMIRLLEATRTVMGDCFLQKIEKGRYRGLLQAIEPDLIRTPDEAPGADQSILQRFTGDEWVNGVRVDRAGRSMEYIICRRNPKGNYEFFRTIPAEDLIQCSYYSRFDQVRGISPLADSLSNMADFYESSEMAFMKIKLASSFGLVTYRDSLDALPGTEATVDLNGDGLNDAGHELDLGGGRPWSLEFGADDKAEILESKTPPTEMVNFLAMASDLIIKSLDLPLAFLDESKPTFHGGKASIKNYDRSCKEKREDLIDILTEVTNWWINMAIADGELSLPAGMQPDEVPFEWIATGMPYWDEEKELASEIAAIGAGLDNPIDAAKRHGRDFKANVDKIKVAQEYAEANDVNLIFAQSTSHSTQELPEDADAEEEEAPETDEIANE